MKQLKQYIFNKISKIITHSLMFQTQNIKYELARRALSSTADYVEKNMKNVISVDTKYKVHDIAIKEVSIDDGVVLEFGVYKADTLNYIAKQLGNYSVFGFDSFEGLPEFWRDGFDKGTFAIDILPQVEKHVKLIKGWFDQTIPKYIENDSRKIAYLHIDCDLYLSTKTIFELLGSRLVEGSVIVFDEYFNYSGWENNEYKAFQEFIRATKKEYKYLTYNYLHEQVAVVITKG